MAAGIFILQKLRCSGFDSKGRHGDNKLVQAITLMQLIDRFGIDVSLSRTGLHLDIKGKIALKDRRAIPVFRRNSGPQGTDVVRDPRISQIDPRILIKLCRSLDLNAAQCVTHGVDRLLLMRQPLLEDQFHSRSLLSTGCRS